jgi:hypothetical protein
MCTGLASNSIPRRRRGRRRSDCSHGSAVGPPRGAVAQPTPIAGHYGGRSFLSRQPVAGIELMQAVAREAAVLVSWCRSTSAGASPSAAPAWARSRPNSSRAGRMSGPRQ